MKEQSHKDEMSKALRGDFERLRDRGVTTTLAPGDETHAEPDVVTDALDEQAEPQAELGSPEPEPEPVTEPVTEQVTEPAADAPDAEPDEPRTSWLSRMLGR